ncbi:DUF3703 domain-containing protein [Reichenbachiella sp.]|uniref:DUF3703 domain-containing protein n=1 Tax=Reichenbachiella sp. TaxID=2184521 RepID=UPI003BB20D48
MKLNTKMSKNLKPIYDDELTKYDIARNRQEVGAAWYHLERAHIIGQRYPFQHTETHWKMFLLGIQTGNFKEIVGQVIRLIFGAPLSLVNKIPVGNVGSSRVSMTRPQPIPEDLQKLLAGVEK